MAVEIRGHVYASRSAKWLRARFKFAWCRQLANWISKRSDFIDCGERQFDHNRLLWDVLAIFYN